MNCVPLISDRPSFAASRTGVEPDPGERLRAREPLARHRRLPFPDEREREVREWSQVAARADGAARGDVRDDSSREEPEQ